MIVDVGTRYVIEHREPHVGEWVMLPGPIYTMILSNREALCQTVCSVVIGTLTIAIGDSGELTYDVRPMPDTRIDGHMTPPPIYYDPARPQGLGNI